MIANVLENPRTEAQPEYRVRLEVCIEHLSDRLKGGTQGRAGPEGLDRRVLIHQAVVIRPWGEERHPLNESVGEFSARQCCRRLMEELASLKFLPNFGLG